ncbi:alkaline phosphatase [Bacillus thuringiensis]|uniref:alkaline phosphatase n=1 Tax=Bacillus thuringiensis TaxID=1428 RepID=UPI00159BB422|nr:alkaline phosphatase [Bacillus thuringiensis]
MKQQKIIMILVDGMSFELMKLPQSVDLSILERTELRDFYPECMEYFDIWERFSHRSFLDPASNRQVKISSADVATMFSVGMYPHVFTKRNHPDQNLFSKLKSQGVKIAAVTNCPLTDSTIGMFLWPNEYQSYKEKTDLSFTNNTDMETNIAAVLDKAPWDLLVGGGRRAFLDKNTLDPVTQQRGIRNDGRNIIQELIQRPEYKLLFENQYNGDFKVNWSHRNLWLLHHGYFRFHAERSATKAQEPRLSDLGLHVIENLDNSEDPWFCLIESGRVDHAAHNNNAYYALGELLEVNRLINHILKKENSADYTIVLTSDHGTGGVTYFEENKVPFNAFQEGIQWGNGPGIKRADTAVYQVGSGAKGLRALKNFTPEFNDASTFRFQPSGDQQRVGSHNRCFVPYMVSGPETNILNNCAFPHDLYYAIQEIYSKQKEPKEAKLILIRDVPETVCKEVARNIGFQYVNSLDHLVSGQAINDDNLNIASIGMIHEIESLLKNGISTVVRISSEGTIDKLRLKHLLAQYDSTVLQVSIDKDEEILVSEVELDSNKVGLEDEIHFTDHITSDLILNNLLKRINYSLA